MSISNKELDFIKNNWSMIKQVLVANEILSNEKHEKSLLLWSNFCNIKVIVYHKDDKKVKDYYIDYIKTYHSNIEIPSYDSIAVSRAYYSSQEIVSDYLGLEGSDMWDNNMEIHPKFMIKNDSRWNRLAAFIIQEQADRLHPERHIIVYRPDKRKTKATV